jgi:quercetin dioxygenase-like cupin family protein
VRVLRDEQTFEEWRPGVMTRLKASSALGTEQLSLFEQWSQPGLGAPSHVHPDDEELIVVLEGEARFTVERRDEDLAVGDTIIVAAGEWHSFANTGEGVLHTLAVFSSATPTVVYADDPDTVLEIGATALRHRSPRTTPT